MVERTGLTTHRHKQIGELSKGYRQRVGLAQAMLHDPEVLILDEPTSGLDPNQIVEIRQLIKDLGKEKTVILSTHILGEVEAVCDRAMIINKGKLVADAPIQELKQQFTGQSIVTVEFAENADKNGLAKIKNVQSVKNLGKNQWQLAAPADKDIRAEVFAFAVANKLTLLELKKETYSVEETVDRLITRNYDLFDFNHTLLPTALPLDQFYKDFRGLYQRAIPIRKQVSMLLQFPLKDIPGLMRKSRRILRRLETAYLDYGAGA